MRKSITYGCAFKVSYLNITSPLKNDTILDCKTAVFFSQTRATRSEHSNQRPEASVETARKNGVRSPKNFDVFPPLRACEARAINTRGSRSGRFAPDRKAKRTAKQSNSRFSCDVIIFQN